MASDSNFTAVKEKVHEVRTDASVLFKNFAVK